MFSVYVIESEHSGKIYIGQTADLARRLRQHNDPSDTSSLYTKRNTGPWKLIYHETVGTRAEALRRERFLKSGKGRELIRMQMRSG